MDQVISRVISSFVHNYRTIKRSNREPIRVLGMFIGEHLKKITTALLIYLRYRTDSQKKILFFRVAGYKG